MIEQIKSLDVNNPNTSVEKINPQKYYENSLQLLQQIDWKLSEIFKMMQADRKKAPDGRVVLNEKSDNDS